MHRRKRRNNIRTGGVVVESGCAVLSSSRCSRLEGEVVPRGLCRLLVVLRAERTHIRVQVVAIAGFRDIADCTRDARRLLLRRLRPRRLLLRLAHVRVRVRGRRILFKARARDGAER